MKNLYILGAYLKSKVSIIFAGLVSCGIFLLVFSLYSLPLEAVVYSFLLVGVLIFVIGVIDFCKFYNKHILLEKIKGNLLLTENILPFPKDLIEKDFQEIIKYINEERLSIIRKKEQDFRELVDYYTLWAHQIKTPISAMRLLLQSEPSPQCSELLDQLFRVEQYVEMVLQYLRLENMSSDLVISRYSLDELVKQAIRKYSKFFIRQKVKLNYKELKVQVLTDEKWLVFVLEQIISNALKYASNGEISIYMEKEPLVLVIEDTGIGIKQEDLPRVFEKGFTGYIGRADKRSTGIGLFLCKQILDRLGHPITIESAVGRGTKVKIGLEVEELAGD